MQVDVGSKGGSGRNSTTHLRVGVSEIHEQVCVREGLAMRQDNRGSPRGQTVDRLVRTQREEEVRTCRLAVNLHPCCLDMAFVGSHLPVSMPSKTITCSVTILSPGAQRPCPFRSKISTLSSQMDRALSSPNKAVVFVRRDLSPNSHRSHFPAPGLPRARPR